MKIKIELTKEEKKLWSKWKPVACLDSNRIGDYRLVVYGNNWLDGNSGYAFGVSFLKELKKQIDKISKEAEK